MSGNSRLPPTPSGTCAKYLRYGAVEMKPFQPGQRYRSRRDKEQSVRGYRAVSEGISATAAEIENQSRRHQSMERHGWTSVAFHNSTVGYTSERLAGNAWQHNYAYNRQAFPPIGRPGQPGLPHAYRYFGTRPVS